MVKLLTLAAPAKVNLFLRVLGRRPDGYHELDSLMVPVALYDRIELEMRPAGSTEVDLRCDAPGVPADGRNLAVRAARAFLTEFGTSGRISINLHKEIPAGAGLGGGSSDAAAVLRGLAELNRLDYSNTAGRLARLAAGLGADVPFFLDPRPARVAGIGERLTPVAALRAFPMVIAVPPVEVSTAAVFRALETYQWSGICPEDDFRAIMHGQFSSRLLVNDLEDVATGICPGIPKLKQLLQETGAIGSAMTGSGGAVFGVFSDPSKAREAADLIREWEPESRVFSTQTV